MCESNTVYSQAVQEASPVPEDIGPLTVMASAKPMLVSLRRSSSSEQFIHELKSSGIDPIIIARPVEWMTLPSHETHLLAFDWDLFIILEADATLSETLKDVVEATYTIDVHLQSALSPNFREDNKQHLLTQKTHVPLTTNFSQTRSLRSLNGQYHQTTPSLLAFADSDLCPKGPISMVNYISYHAFPSASESYRKYIDGVRAGPMERIGGRVKFFGTLSGEIGTERQGWDECLIAEYPSKQVTRAPACYEGYWERLLTGGQV